MLVLTRKLGEIIVINNNIEVIILSAKGGCVRVGIEAPKDIPVHRKEISEKILINAKNNEFQVGIDENSLRDDTDN